MSLILDAVKKYDAWLYLSLADIRLRYRRSALGPLWITISMAIFSISIGLVYSQLFNAKMDTYLPYLTVSVIVWTFIAASLNESTSLYCDNAPYIKDLNFNVFSITFRALSRQVIILAHNSIVILGVLIFFQVPVSWTIIYSAAGIFLLILMLVPVAACLSLIGARFRDIGQLIANILQVLFFLTPITWETTFLQEKSWIYIYNPLYHFIDVVRAPLLGKSSSPSSWLICCTVVIAAWVCQEYMFNRKRARLAFWI
ncbi:ABC transporter permease [Rhizobiales bacterium TNE-4]|nr:ABC transporter permease [Rhizobiales bacterium TNE-4]MBV1827568.1 ABC transporter permease [Rhizobiales bacterium TNE-4]